jgi:hypothetical protein
MKPARNIRHFHQQKHYTCGAATIAMLFGISEVEACKLVKTTSSGTNMMNVCSFLKECGVTFQHVFFGQDYQDSIDNLVKLSFKFPIYISGEFRDKFFKKGRERVRHHAIAIVDGKVYDPSEQRELEGESYRAVFNRSLKFKSIIIIEEERPDYIKNFSEFIQ